MDTANKEYVTPLKPLSISITFEQSELIRPIVVLKEEVSTQIRSFLYSVQHLENLLRNPESKRGNPLSEGFMMLQSLEVAFNRWQARYKELPHDLTPLLEKLVPIDQAKLKESYELLPTEVLESQKIEPLPEMGLTSITRDISMALKELEWVLYKEWHRRLSQIDHYNKSKPLSHQRYYNLPNTPISMQLSQSSLKNFDEPMHVMNTLKHHMMNYACVFRVNHFPITQILESLVFFKRDTYPKGLDYMRTLLGASPLAYKEVAKSLSDMLSEVEEKLTASQTNWTVIIGSLKLENLIPSNVSFALSQEKAPFAEFGKDIPKDARVLFPTRSLLAELEKAWTKVVDVIDKKLYKIISRYTHAIYAFNRTRLLRALTPRKTNIRSNFEKKLNEFRQEVAAIICSAKEEFAKIGEKPVIFELKITKEEAEFLNKLELARSAMLNSYHNGLRRLVGYYEKLEKDPGVFQEGLLMLENLKEDASLEEIHQYGIDLVAMARTLEKPTPKEPNEVYWVYEKKLTKEEAKATIHCIKKEKGVYPFIHSQLAEIYSSQKNSLDGLLDLSFEIDCIFYDYIEHFHRRANQPIPTYTNHFESKINAIKKAYDKDKALFAIYYPTHVSWMNRLLHLKEQALNHYHWIASQNSQSVPDIKYCFKFLKEVIKSLQIYQIQLLNRATSADIASRLDGKAAQIKFYDLLQKSAELSEMVFASESVHLSYLEEIKQVALNIWCHVISALDQLFCGLTKRIVNENYIQRESSGRLLLSHADSEIDKQGQSLHRCIKSALSDLEKLYRCIENENLQNKTIYEAAHQATIWVQASENKKRPSTCEISDRPFKRG